MSEEQINELIEYNLDYSIEEDLEETKKCLKEANKEIERLNNIIKEVREYIMTNGIHSDYGDKGIDDENKLLAILDKGSE